SWVLSCSVSRVSSTSLRLTPAACSCSSSRSEAMPSSLANWETFVCAMFVPPVLRPARTPSCEPGRARRHDQRLGALRVHADQLYQIIDRQLGEFFLRVNALGGELPRGLAVHALQCLQIGRHLFDLLFAGDVLHE